jgi:hypothetical protein
MVKRSPFGYTTETEHWWVPTANGRTPFAIYNKRSCSIQYKINFSHKNAFLSLCVSVCFSLASILIESDGSYLPTYRYLCIYANTYRMHFVSQLFCCCCRSSRFHQQSMRWYSWGGKEPSWERERESLCRVRSYYWRRWDLAQLANSSSYSTSLIYRVFNYSII